MNYPIKSSGLLLLFFASSFLLSAQEDKDKNVVITNQEVKCNYTTDRNGNVIVKESDHTLFECTQYNTNILFVEFYNDQIKIDDIRFKSKGDHIFPKREQYSSNGIFYSDEKICYANLDFPQKGHKIEVSLDKTYSDVRYFTRMFFTETQFVNQKTVEIVVPRWMKMEIKEMNFDGNNITKEVRFDSKKNTDTYIYTIHDLDPFKSESNAPGNTYIYPHLLILNKYAEKDGKKQVFFNSLDDLYGWYHSLVLEIGNDKNVIGRKAKEITQGCTNELDKIKTVYEWVQKNIRYIAFEDGIAGFKPAPAQEVLSKKYGDCKGMANLTKELLCTLGFDARLCWLGTDHLVYDYTTPSLTVDNHMICALFYQDSIYYLDATVKYIAFNNYPRSIQNRQVLIENGDKYLLERIPERSAEQNTETEKSVLSITGDALTGSVELSYIGESKNWFLSNLDNIKKQNQETALLEYLKENSNVQYEIKNLVKSGLTPKSDSIKIAYDIVNKAGINLYNDEYYIDPDFRKEFINSKIDLEKRKRDRVYPYKFNIVQQNTIAIPKGYKVSSLPENLSIERDGYSFTISYSKTKDSIIYNKKIILKKAKLKKADFETWNKDIDQLKKKYLEQIVLTK